MEFIYLVPGNWFELKNLNKKKAIPFDINALKDEILNQVNNRSDKLSFIDITFGSKYVNKSVDSIEFYLDQDKFNLIAEILSKETRHPIITFHGTSLKSVESILRTGYFIPGLNKNLDKNLNKNLDKKAVDSIRVAHGSAYGIGVYSSPFFDKAMYYTTPDNKYVYMLINLVFLGKMKLIPPHGTCTNFGAPVNGIYADGSNTRIVYGLEQLITAESNRVIPIAVMKISIS